MDKNIIVGMSGGVDSSVTALLLKQQGYTVQGLFMKNWEEDDSAEYCSAAEDLSDAQAVCDVLDIPLHTVNFASEYWDSVFAHFLAEYKAGRTPNPDVLCNREIKFKVFLDYAKQLGAAHIATGHYAQIAHEKGKYQLRKGIDSNKDQSYFLYMLGQAQLAPSFFPIGGLEKPAVRKMAEAAGLITHKKKDSTGICFIGERKFKDFLSQYLPMKKGIIRTPEGEAIGEHDGVMYYTSGQRQGLCIGGRKGSSGEAWYVVAKDVASNELTVVQGKNHPLLFTHNLYAADMYWVAGKAPTSPCICAAKNRYRQTEQACVLTEQTDGRYLVKFAQPQRAVTAGQSVVFYLGQICLGGGIIEGTF